VLSDEALELLLKERGGAVIPIAGEDTSMAPHLAGGDLIAAGPLKHSPRVGDLLVFRQRDYLVVHRYLGTARTPDGTPCLRTRGDGRNELDPPVAPSAVRARVTAVRRAGSWRSLDGPVPEAYARLVAWHDHAWAIAGIVGRRIGAGTLVTTIDRVLLRVASMLLFSPFHRRIAPPAQARAETSV